MLFILGAPESLSIIKSYEMQVSSSLIPNWQSKTVFEGYIRSLNKHIPPNAYSVSYIDEDGDEIACNTQTDFDLANQMVKESEKKEIIFTVKWKEQDCPSQEDKQEMESQSFEEEMRSITEKHQMLEASKGDQELKEMKKKKCKAVKKQTERQPVQKRKKSKEIMQYVTKAEVIRLIQEHSILSSSQSQPIEECDAVQIAGVFCCLCQAGISIPYYINPQTQAKICHICEPTYDSTLNLIKIRNQITAIQLTYVNLTEVTRADIPEEPQGKIESTKLLCETVMRKTKEQFNLRIKQIKREIQKEKKV